MDIVLSSLFVLFISFTYYLLHDKIHNKMSVLRKGEKILFVVAHPDDEAMFFAPTILSFAQRHVVVSVSVCISVCMLAR